MDTIITEKNAWGLNPSEMYFVGLHGTLVHYDGNSLDESFFKAEQTLPNQ